mgnify:CR=1 FL=1
MKYFIRTFGCKTNQYESELMKHLLKENGHQVVSDYCDADVVVINSCAVTQPAERDVYKFIRRVDRESKQTDRVLLIGCYAEYINQLNLYNDFFNRLNSKINVEFFGNKDKYFFIDKKFTSCNIINCGIKKFYGEKRAYVKIQDGCNNFCSYCIVAYLRNEMLSKPLEVVLKEIEELLKNQYYEIYLVGTNIGKYSYLHNGKKFDLVDLSEEILRNFDQVTIIFSSLEPPDLNEKFFDFLEKYRQRIFPHFHIPLQSADDEILLDMNRKYSVSEYENKIIRIRNIMPEAIISSDVILGYPIETKEKFLKTLNFIEKVKFNWVHVFPYSPRKGTLSYKKYGNFSCYDAKYRVRELNKLNEKLGEKFFKKLCKI